MSINIRDTLQGYARIKGIGLTELNEMVNTVRKEKGLKPVSQSSFSQKINNETMRLKEFELYLDTIGYKIKIVDKNE